ncbi:hypothetical protein OH77DRAFT_160876 [Trametes cingulata]|nr:hypothetical protein OH77DRAFT_160876 [Trametes cingulata]
MAHDMHHLPARHGPPGGLNRRLHHLPARPTLDPPLPAKVVPLNSLPARPPPSLPNPPPAKRARTQHSLNQNFPGTPPVLQDPLSEALKEADKLLETADHSNRGLLNIPGSQDRKRSPEDKIPTNA